MQSEFINFFWDLLRSLPRNIRNADAFRDEFSSKLEILKRMIDEGSDINVRERRTGLTCLDMAINKYNFKIYLGQTSFVEELLYFLLSHDNIRPTIDTIYMAAVVCKDERTTEEILKRCDDETLNMVENQINFYLTPSILEVFQGFGLRL